MAIFESMYDRVLRWAEHRFAVPILAVFSFIESIFFPIPTDVLLIPISLRSPNRTFYLAAVTTVASVVGGLIGYLLGAYSFELLQPYIQQFGYADKYERVIDWFEIWGFWM